MPAKKAAKGSANYNHVRRADQASGGSLSKMKKSLKSSGALKSKPNAFSKMYRSLTGIGKKK